MKTIRIKSLTLVNFKGFKNETFEFGQQTVVSGCNGLGKTTIVDAFLWLMFGRNSAGNTAFGIKTVGADGTVIPRLSHEVAAVIFVDDKEVLLRKTLTEKWVKPRGKTAEEFQGNETSYEVNNVPYKAKEYAVYIESILPESAFRAVTNPNYFTSLPWQEQKQLLITLVGGVSQDEIVSGAQSFARLLAEIQDKDIELYRREVVARKNKCKAEAEAVEPRIDEVKRSFPAEPDHQQQAEAVAAINTETSENNTKIAECQEEIKSIDSSLSDISSRMNAATAAQQSLINRKSDLQQQLTELTAKITSEANTEYSKAISIRNIAIDTNNTTENSIRNIERSIEDLRSQRDEQEQSRVRLRADIDAANSDIKSIKAEVYIPESTVCPTCGQPLPDDVLAEAEARFNNSKAERIKTKEDNIKTITSKGIAAKNLSEQLAQQIAAKMSEADSLRKSLKPIPAEPQRPVVDYKSDLRYIAIEDEIKKLDSQIAAARPADMPDNSALLSRKQQLNNIITTLSTRNSELASTFANINATNASFSEQTDRLNARIDELTKQLQGLNQEIASLECMEDMITEYKRREVEILETKINIKFQLCRWRFYKPLINGGFEETCECTVNGVPFADVNRAAQINAGIDIINALQSFYDFAAPIFIDNAEAVNSLLSTPAQTIALHVTTDNSLTFKNL